jgi:hypothetical protein
VQPSALYVDPRGPYPQLVTDWWDKSRDARLYRGTSPVVAHPPCGPWGTMRYFCTKQDPDLAIHAVDQVRRCGGVLEHPRGSLLWGACNLPRPYRQLPLLVGREWSLEVRQVDWGHQALKRTYLFFVGVSPADLPPLPPRRPHTHFIAAPGRTADRLRAKGLLEHGKDTHLTPPDFARWLVTAASRSRA